MNLTIPISPVYWYEPHEIEQRKKAYFSEIIDLRAKVKMMEAEIKELRNKLNQQKP